MEAFILYSLVCTAVGLMLVGTYGAMPLLVEAPASSVKPNHAALPVPIGPLAISETTLVARTDVQRPKDRRASLQGPPPQGAPGDDLSETESILLGLHDEVDLMRNEIEGLRGELSALIEIANRRSQGTLRARKGSDVPEPLRRRVNATRQVRVQTRSEHSL
jgi:hypothetical protein